MGFLIPLLFTVNYAQLQKKFVLRPIRTQEQCDKAIAMVQYVLTKIKSNQDAIDYLEVISDLIGKFKGRK